MPTLLCGRGRKEGGRADLCEEAQYWSSSRLPPPTPDEDRMESKQLTAEKFHTCLLLSGAGCVTVYPQQTQVRGRREGVECGHTETHPQEEPLQAVCSGGAHWWSHIRPLLHLSSVWERVGVYLRHHSIPGNSTGCPSGGPIPYLLSTD